MIYCFFQYKDIFLSEINLFILKLIDKSELKLTNMDVRISGEIGEVGIAIDKVKIFNTIHSGDFSIIIRNSNIQYAISRSTQIRNKVNIVALENQTELSSLTLNYYNNSDLQYVKRENNEYVALDKTLDYDYWIYWKRPIPQPMEYIPVFDFNNPNKKELSIEHIPGHTHYMRQDEELIFEAAWQMYFGDVYYKYIPKPLFDDFSDCFENIILENGTRRITLYDDPNAFNNPKNIDRAWSFRRKLGIDSIAHELTKGKNRIEPLNLPVIITKKNCEKGQTKVTRYLDKNDNLIASNLAVKKEIIEYLDDGITVVLKKTETI